MFREIFINTHTYKSRITAESTPADTQTDLYTRVIFGQTNSVSSRTRAQKPGKGM